MNRKQGLNILPNDSHGSSQKPLTPILILSNDAQQLEDGFDVGLQESNYMISISHDVEINVTYLLEFP